MIIARHVINFLNHRRKQGIAPLYYLGITQSRRPSNEQIARLEELVDFLDVDEESDDEDDDYYRR